ncbi:hypothetical protein C8R46DRAFT_1356123 [Mycena filopes]|nr:hypothetical protein C8R46DRAFT_1356123 [Mycena filopes]
MHRCLQIQEIITLILGNLSPETRGDARDLTSLARTAKIFQDPALDILWKTQNSAVNLLRCMPADAFAIIQHTHHRELRLLRPIMAADWERPKFYMHRVKILTALDRSYTSLSQIFSALAVSLPLDVVFPNLTSLTRPAEDFHYIRLFLTQSITSITVSFQHSEHQLSLLSLLDRKCPALKNVWLAISTFLCGLGDLHSLTSRITDMAALEHVAQLPNLRSIRTVVLPPKILPSEAMTVSRFPRLRHLDLDYVTVEQATDLLPMCSDSPLDRLDVGFHAFPAAAELVQFSTALAACRNAHLRLDAIYIDLSNDGVETDDGAQYVLPIDFLRNLCCFGRLTDINISTYHGFDLTGAGVAELARAWPVLEELRLAEEVPPTRSPPLHCLSSIAQHCPRLRYLHITVDARDDEMPVWTQQPPTQINLTSLHVGHSPIFGDSSAARFLSAIFPALQSITTQREYEEGEGEDDFGGTGLALFRYHQRWSAVEDQIPVLVAARDEGRLWGPIKS